MLNFRRGAQDCMSAYEIFQTEVYSPARLLGDVEHVVDLGAYVGFSCLYWLRMWPSCRVIAYEPHPSQAEAARKNIAANGFSEAVEIRTAAASVANGRVYLVPGGMSSRLTEEAGGGEIPVEVRDVFQDLLGRRIDLLKIDIEGSEYEILSDRRFASLLPRAIFLEVHPSKSHPQGKKWCSERLQNLGYRVENYLNMSGVAMLAAVKPD